MEVFKDIAGYEGSYAVSNVGNVKSMRRVVGKGDGTMTIRERILKPRTGPSGHLLVNLCVNGKMSTRKVHRLVAAAFIGPCPEGMEVAHNDGNPVHNVVENLRYDTRAGNQADRLKHGTSNRGERSGRNKLSEAQVLAIRADTRKPRAISADYGIDVNSVWAIRTRKNWSWLT